MKTLHHAMMGVTMIAILAAAAGVIHPWATTAEAQHSASRQHGEVDDPQEHFAALADMLTLTAAQREALQAPFAEAFAAMQQLHQLHDVIAAELTDEQSEVFGNMIHKAMAEQMGHHEDQADHRGHSHP